MGVMFFPVYYFMADIAIKKLNLATPGRMGNITGTLAGDEAAKAAEGKGSSKEVAAK